MCSNFRDTHRALIVLNALVGYCVPGPTQISIKTYRFLYYHSRAIITAAVIHSFCLLLGIHDHHNVASLCSNFVVFSLSLFNTYIATYFIMNEGRFGQLILAFDQVAFLCDKDPLSKLDFGIRLNNNVKLFVLFSSLMPLLDFFLTLAFLILAYVQSFKLAVIWFPCEYNRSPCFEIAFIYNAVLTLIYSVQKVSYELFIMSMLLWLRTYFEHLKSSVENVFVKKHPSEWVKQYRATSIYKANIALELECLSMFCDDKLMPDAVVFNSNTKKYHKEDDSGSSGIQDSFNSRESDAADCINTPEMKLQHWTELHQKVLRLSDDFIQLHAPMFTAYLAHIICHITLSFLFLTEKSNEYLAREIGFLISLFGVATLGLMCVIGDSVAQQSEAVTEEVYSRPWYNASKAAKSHLLIILARTRKAFEASSLFPCAKLNKETYVSRFGFFQLCNLILSYYLGLVNMKRAKQSQP